LRLEHGDLSDGVLHQLVVRLCLAGFHDADDDGVDDVLSLDTDFFFSGLFSLISFDGGYLLGGCWGEDYLQVGILEVPCYLNLLIRGEFLGLHVLFVKYLLVRLA
jgi:hypothetical protein